MMGLRMKMFLSFGILCFLLDNGLGAPARGRYMWLKCNPNGLDPNCVKQKGPLMDISGLPDRLPASAVKDLMNKNSALELQEPMGGAEEQRKEEPEEEQDGDVYEADPEEEEEEEEEPLPEVVEPVEEQSGEGSAAGPFLNDQGSGEQWADYSSYAVPGEVMTGQVMPPVQEMKEEHLIL